MSTMSSATDSDRLPWPARLPWYMISAGMLAAFLPLGFLGPARWAVALALAFGGLGVWLRYLATGWRRGQDGARGERSTRGRKGLVLALIGFPLCLASLVLLACLLSLRPFPRSIVPGLDGDFLVGFGVLLIGMGLVFGGGALVMSPPQDSAAPTS